MLVLIEWGKYVPFTQTETLSLKLDFLQVAYIVKKQKASAVIFLYNVL